MNKEWWKKSVVYQIYPKSFKDSNNDGIGDIQGIISQLDYLKELGIDVIWLSPIYQSPMIDNGYDISDYQAIHPDYGTMADFENLLKEAHQRSIKIVMDLVVNHTSDEHKWFKEAVKSADNPYHNYYIWRDKPTNFGSLFSGSAWTYQSSVKQYYLHTFSSKQADLNWDYQPLREEIYKMMRWWLDKGIDGFRMDVISLISKKYPLTDGIVHENNVFGDITPFIANGPNVHRYLQEMNEKVLSHYPIMTIGECPCVNAQQALDYVDSNRHELNMIFTFDHVSLDNDCNGKWNTKKTSLIDLKKTLNKWQSSLSNQGWNTLYLSNHDQPRSASRFGNETALSAKCLALTLHFMKGTPFIYQGEELGMTNICFNDISECQDIEAINAYRELVTEEHLFSHEEMMKNINAKARDHARTPMQWNNDQYSGFSHTFPWLKVNPNYQSINTKIQLNDQESVFHFYQKLIKIRHDYQIITDGDYCPLFEDHPDLFAYRRCYQNAEIIILANWSEKVIDYDMDLSNYRILLANSNSIIKNHLNAYEAVAYYK